MVNSATCKVEEGGVLWNCAHAFFYAPYYFFTKYPHEVSKIYNIAKLFTPILWMWTFISMGSIVVGLKLATFVGTRLGLNTCTDELILFPLRLVNKILDILYFVLLLTVLFL